MEQAGGAASAALEAEALHALREAAGTRHAPGVGGDVEVVTSEEIRCSPMLKAAPAGDKQPCVLLITIGSRGDVNPFLAIGEEFAARGYHVRLATHLAFKDVVERFGFEYCKLAGDPRVLMNLMASYDAVSSPRNLLRNYRTYRAILHELLEDIWACVTSSPEHVSLDLVVANPISHCGVHIAEYLKIPAVMLFTMPWTRSRELPFPLYMSDCKSSSSVLNPPSYGLFETAMWFSIVDIVNKFREERLGLPALSMGRAESSTSNINMHGRKVPFIYCWSKHVIPKPLDWGNHIMVSGYLVARDDRRALCGEPICEPAGDDPGDERSSGAAKAAAAESFRDDPELQEFLAAAVRDGGAGPLYIGFGSINCEEETMRGIAACITRGLHLLACRRGSDGDLGLVGSRHVILQSLNHRQLFEEELANPENKCTVMRSQGFFRPSEPSLTTRTASPPPGPEGDKQAKAAEGPSRSASAPDLSTLLPTAFAPARGDILEEEAAEAWDSLHKNVLILGEAKHSALFKRCSMVVHHGGAGTFMTALHAGVPQLVVPFFGDQFLWGDVAIRKKIGLGVPASSFGTAAFVKGVATCLGAERRAAASTLGWLLREEMSRRGSGVVRAVSAIEEWISHDSDVFDPEAAAAAAAAEVKEEENKCTPSLEDIPEDGIKIEQAAELSKGRGCSGSSECRMQ